MSALNESASAKGAACLAQLVVVSPPAAVWRGDARVQAVAAGRHGRPAEGCAHGAAGASASAVARRVPLAWECRMNDVHAGQTACRRSRMPSRSPPCVRPPHCCTGGAGCPGGALPLLCPVCVGALHRRHQGVSVRGLLLLSETRSCGWPGVWQGVWLLRRLLLPLPLLLPPAMVPVHVRAGQPPCFKRRFKHRAHGTWLCN